MVRVHFPGLSSGRILPSLLIPELLASGLLLLGTLQQVVLVLTDPLDARALLVLDAGTHGRLEGGVAFGAGVPSGDLLVGLVLPAVPTVTRREGNIRWGESVK